MPATIRNRKFIAMLSVRRWAAFCIPLLLLIGGTAEARIFKWVDANGKTHYSERAPDRQQAQEIYTQPAPPTVNNDINNPASQFMQQEEMNHFARKSAEEAQAKSTAEIADAARRTRCAQAKNELHGFQQQVRIFTIGNDGQRVFMDDDTRATFIARAKKKISENCDSD